MKIIFLDIDGVLNNRTTIIPYGLDKLNIKNLNYLIQKTDVKIVLSSAWRYLIIDGQMTLKGFETMMRTHGLNCLNRFVGLTTCDDIMYERWHQIDLWLRSTAEIVDKFVILDDCEEFPNYPNNFIKTDGDIGLTLKDVESAINILGEK